MTAINIVRKRNSVVIMSDGFGQIVGTDLPPVPMTKVAMLPHIPLVVATRGLGVVGNLFIAAVAAKMVEDFDACLPIVEALARQDIPAVSAHQKYTGKTEMNVVGYSRSRQRFERYFLCSDNSYLMQTGLPAYELRLDEEANTAGPRPSDEALAATGFRMPHRDEDYDPLTHGLRFMEAQRQTYPDGVGGFYQVTTVTKEGVSSRIVKRWPG